MELEKGKLRPFGDREGAALGVRSPAPVSSSSSGKLPRCPNGTLGGLELCRAVGWLAASEMCVFLLVQVILGQVVQRYDPAVPQLPVKVDRLFLLHLRRSLHHFQGWVVMVTILHCLQLLSESLLVLPLGDALVAAAIEGGDEEQEGSHADDGDNEWQAEAVLVGFWWSFPPQHHVTDPRLSQVIPFVLQTLKHDFRRKLRLDNDSLHGHRPTLQNRGHL